MIGVSVIIPTYNRPSMLRKTLCGLATQMGYSGALEVIIVDNGSKEDSFAAISDLNSLLHIRLVKRRLIVRHFRPGSARNIGAIFAQYDTLLFLDSDCIPSQYFIALHAREHTRPKHVVTLGHRVFVDNSVCSESMILSGKNLLSSLPQVKSTSNYDKMTDRRIEELVMLSTHPAPYNCLHGCNVGIQRDDFLSSGMFDVSFDGYWGYEDIELGYRLFTKGIPFVYLSGAPVYHLEGEGLSLSQRLTGRARNYKLVCKRIPHFHSFRRELGR